MLPLAIGSTIKKWPNLQVQIIEGVWDRLADALVSHEIDLALGSTSKTLTRSSLSRIAVGRTPATWLRVGAILCEKPDLKLADTLQERWAMLPKGTGPFEHMKKVFSRQNPALPNIVVETRSVMALKSLIGRSGFLGWMPEPMYDAERKAGLIDAPEMPGASDKRVLTAFRRRPACCPVRRSSCSRNYAR